MAAHDAANRFMVRPGHVFEDVERVVRHHETYEVVEKLDINVDEEWSREGG